MFVWLLKLAIGCHVITLVVTIFGVIMWHPLCQCNCTLTVFGSFMLKLMLDSLYKMLAALCYGKTENDYLKFSTFEVRLK